MSDKIIKTEAQWAEELSPEQYAICRGKGTERAFTGKYNDCKTAGTYVCACCSNPLYSAQTKYDSGSGWPSFYEPLNPEAVDYKEDVSLFSRRTEVLCARCDAHLGHVFDDGPQPTGQRFCMNSLSLELMPDAEID